MSQESTKTVPGQTDVAALGSGVVGVAVAMLIQPGAFNPLVAIVAITLALVIVSYIGGHRRSGFQQAAFASVMGVLAIPVVGTALESNWQSPDSHVDTVWLIVTWIVVGLITFGVDASRQHRLSRQDGNVRLASSI